ncbi:MAG: ABC transporter permease [Actinobacteria bacterium]|nr:ABC transporter permease [Actinomycetota bacterium]MBO0834515.1 ABC transporter permease [Actinomycetota bacterium]
MSETAERPAAVTPESPGTSAAASGSTGWIRRTGILLMRQREATVLVVVVLLIVYFGFINAVGRATFFSKVDLVNLSVLAAPIIIIALGEVLLLICGEIDLSVGFVYAFAPYVMHFLIDYYHVPGILAIVLAVAFGAAVGWINAFLTITLGLPSFITTLGTGFVLGGLILTLGHGEQAAVPHAVLGIGHWLGNSDTFVEIIWAVVLTAIFHMILRHTRWGLHTIAVGGNQLGAAEAGVNVARIKYGNFMITSALGAFVGIQIAFQTNLIDTFSGGAAYQPMLYAVAAAVIGGTAMLGGSGTMIGAFLGGAVLAVLQDGFSVIGVSAYPLQIWFGGAILLAMIGNVQLARLRGEGRVRAG